VFAKHLKHDITFFSETWLKNRDNNFITEMMKNTGYDYYAFSHETNSRRGRPSGGTLWVLSDRIKGLCEIHKINARIQKCLVKTEPPLLLVGVYMPSTNNSCEIASNNEYDENMCILQQLVNETTENDTQLIIIGDFNSDPRRASTYNDKTFSHFITNHNTNLSLIDYLFTQKLYGTFRNNGTSWIDHIVINDKCKTSIDTVNIIASKDTLEKLDNESIDRRYSTPAQTKLANELWDELNQSDHRGIELSIRTLKVSENNKKTLVCKQQPIDWLNAITQIEYKSVFHKNIMSESIIPQLLETINDTNFEKAQKVKIKINKYGKFKKYWSPQLTELCIVKKLKYIKWTQTKNDVTWQEYKQLNKEFRKEIRKAKQMHDDKFISDLNKYHQEDILKFWRKCKIKCKTDNQIPVEPDKAAEFFSEFFRGDHSYRQWLDEENNKSYENKINLALEPEEEIDREMMSRLIKTLKNGKAPGYHGVTNEMLKYADSTILCEIICQLIEAMLKFGRVPTNINIGLIKPIIKDVNKNHSDLTNTRPITISDTISNLLESYILEKVLANVKDTQNQFGFKQNCSCGHAIYTFRETIAYHKMKNKKIYACAIDLKKAFDRLNRTKLFKELQQEMAPRWWNLMYKYYNQSKAVVEINNKRSKFIKIETGVKQGGPMSPALFNRYVYPMIEELIASGLTCKINEQTTGILMFADDILISTTSIENMNRALDIVTKYCKKYDLHINASKSQMMKLNKDLKTIENVKVNGETLDNAAEIKYLGVIINSKLTNNSHLQDRKFKAFNAMYIIKQLGAENHLTKTKMRIHLYKTYVRPVLLYGLAEIQLSAQEIKKIQSIENIIIKQILKIHKKTRSRTLMRALKINLIEEELLKRKTTLYHNLMKNQFTGTILDSIGNQIDELRYQDSNNENLSRTKLNKLNKAFTKEVVDLSGVTTFDKTTILAELKREVKANNEIEKREQVSDDVRKISECLGTNCKTNNDIIKRMLYVNYENANEINRLLKNGIT
jgi:hypothetical protein